MMAKNALKPWVCRNDDCKAHLGRVVRNGNGIRQLLLYRHAVDSRAELPAEVDVIGILEGQMNDVRCELCGAVRTWVPGREALLQLLKRCGIKEVVYDNIGSEAAE